MSQFIEMFGDTHMRSDHSRQWKEVVEIINGKDYKSIQVEDGGYPVYGTGGEMARASDYLSPANSILLGRKGTIDKPLLIREKYWNVDTAFGAVPDEKVLHYVYFYWHCKTIDFNVLNKGTTLPSTTKVDLLNLWIKIPSMEEQTRFGSIVEQADKSKFDDFKSQFIEMFGNSPQKELGELATFVNGSAFKPEEWSQEGLPIVRIQNLTQGDAPYNYYSGDTSKKVCLNTGDILVSWSATLGVFTWSKGPALLNQHIFKVVFDKLDIEQSFFIYTVKLALEKMADKAHGSTMRHVVKKDFDSTKVSFPSMREQQRFVSIAEQADKSKSVIQKALVYLNDIQSGELGKIA